MFKIWKYFERGQVTACNNYTQKTVGIGPVLPELPSFFCNRKKLELRKKVYEDKDFCKIILLSEDSKILKFNQI